MENTSKQYNARPNSNSIVAGDENREMDARRRHQGENKRRGRKEMAWRCLSDSFPEFLQISLSGGRINIKMEVSTRGIHEYMGLNKNAYLIEIRSVLVRKHVRIRYESRLKGIKIRISSRRNIVRRAHNFPFGKMVSQRP